MILKPDAPQYTIAAVNNSYLGATNTECSSIIGKGLFEVFPDNPEDLTATGVNDLRISLERVLQDKVQDVMGIQKYDTPKRNTDENGFEVKYWSPINTPVFDENGFIVYIIHRVEDVTEFIQLSKKSSHMEKIQAKADQMEAEVLRSSREVREVNRRLKAVNEELQKREKELVKLNKRLQEVDQAKTAFFSKISHEFRTPLTLMLAPIEDTLHDINTIPENRERMDVAYRNVLRLLKLVNNLLDFASIEAGRTQITYQPTNLSTLTQELASMFNSATTKAGLKFTVDCQHLT